MFYCCKHLSWPFFGGVLVTELLTVLSTPSRDHFWYSIRCWWVYQDIDHDFWVAKIDYRFVSYHVDRRHSQLGQKSHQWGTIRHRIPSDYHFARLTANRPIRKGVSLNFSGDGARSTYFRMNFQGIEPSGCADGIDVTWFIMTVLLSSHALPLSEVNNC